ncbi:MAG: sigma-70 family RNA polymerase sigma factor [Opitutae bacterium]|nr:sigma-70 family RNA polymerase sigma factor [Opitutae bacterium]
MLPTHMPALASLDDAALVTATLAGDRDAFSQIVTRYQALVCSLAYNATGSVRQSEDLAQETFVAAWRDLSQLRETTKLRGWLCSIARHKISRAFSASVREPAHAAEPLDAAYELAATDPLPSEQAVTREEQAILWRSLEQIPESYREPLILFYRENHSVERVAAALELTEDAVKQRLSRGRKLLQDQVAAFVEVALQRTAPGAAFTTSVLSALPGLTVPAAAAAVAKGAVVKTTGTGGLAVAILGPVVAILGAWLGYQVSLESADRAKAASPREREFLRQLAWRVWLAAGVLVLLLFTGVYFDVWLFSHSERLVEPFAIICGGYGVALVLTLLSASRRLHEFRREEAENRPPASVAPAPPWFFRPFEYRSRWTLLGLPLIHIRMQQTGAAGQTLPAVGWIAIGNIARGGLFAFGGLAFAPVCLGGGAVGLLAMGGFGVGVFSFAGAAFGVWAVGGVAAGYLASGGAALGWLGACGGVAVAHDFAVGGAAAAQNINDDAARAFVQHSEFFRWAKLLSQHAMILLWLPLGIVVGQVLGLRRKR